MIHWYGAVEAAADRVTGVAHRTPVLTSQTLNAEIGAEVYLKCENFQRVGAFKFRGAWNTVSQLSAREKAAGVLAFSSGNHAQAVALASKLHQVQATILMPSDAPPAKIEATRGYGAHVVTYDPLVTTRESVAAQMQAEHPRTLIPPYDHPHVVAGQGTAAWELLQEVPDLDLLLTPCGGGGLLSGSAVVLKKQRPQSLVMGVEPAFANDGAVSFRTGMLHQIAYPPTLADGTRTPFLGQITFPLIRRYVDDMLEVSEADIARSVAFLFQRMKLVVEPAGALGVAALLGGAVVPRGKVGVILSGGNVDNSVFAAILEARWQHLPQRAYRPPVPKAPPAEVR